MVLNINIRTVKNKGNLPLPCPGTFYSPTFGRSELAGIYPRLGFMINYGESKKITHNLIRRIEVSLFPEFAGSNEFFPAQEKQIISAPKSKYSYFSPTWHFESGIITREMIDDMTTNRYKKMLSVGAGPAYLERLLVKLGVWPQQIILADIDGSMIPKGFEFYEFDMFGDWPSFQERFDYIIFPESAFLLSDEMVARLSAQLLLANCLSNLKKHGQIRLTPTTCFKVLFRKHPPLSILNFDKFIVDIEILQGTERQLVCVVTKYNRIWIK